MEAWENDPVASPQSGAASWQSDPVVQPPKVPDTSGIKKMAQDNLAANDNKEGDIAQNTQERYNTALGQPLHTLMNPDDTTPVNYGLRKQYTKMLQNGDAVNFGDAAQTILHTIAPIAQGIIHPVDTTENYAKGVYQGAIAGMKSAPAAIAGAISPEIHQELVEAGDLEAPIRPAIPGQPTGPEMIAAATQGERQSLGAGVSALFWPVASLLGPAINPLIEKTGGAPQKPGEPLTYQQTIPGVIGSAMDIAGMGALGGAHEIARPLGPWDNHPGSEPIKQLIAKKTDTDPAAVSSSAVDQSIAQGVNHKSPTGEDFKSVATVTGIPEPALHNVYAETGVKPDQVFIDAQHNPEIATDVAAGKVPPQYEHLVAEKPIMPEAKTEALNVVKDEATRSFNVVDKDGDHVSSGFDSAQEAQHYIEDEKFRAEERAAIEGEPVDKTNDILKQYGEQQKARAIKEADKYRGQIEPNWSTKDEVGLFDMPSEIKSGTPEHQAYADKVYDRRINSGQYQADNIDNPANPLNPKTVKDYSNGNKLISEIDGFRMLEPFKEKEYPSGYKENIANTIGTLKINKETGVHNFSVSPEYRGKGIGQELLKAADAAGFDVGLSKDRSPSYVKAIKRFNESKVPTELDVAGKQGEQLAAANEGRLKPTAAQKPASEGLFDVAGRGQQDMFTAKPNIIPPSETGRVTSLKQFLRNNGAKFDENGNLVSMSGKDLDHATELAHQYGYTPERLSIPELQNLVKETPTHPRAQDTDRVAKAEENAKQKQWKDPAFVEDQAHKAGIDTTPIKDETEKQRTNRLLKALQEFYKSEEGYGSTDAIRQIIGGTIQAAEKFAGKLTGGMFDKLADGYVRTFQPELMGDKALRADAYLAKHKAALQEAQNSYYRASELEIRRWEKAGLDAQKEWLYDHETGRWSEANNPDHARTQAMYDALREQERNAGVGSDAYKENYLPHQYENPEAVEKYFRSEGMIKKYGKDWFNKASIFKLIEEADRAGFKLRTYNPERMLVARQQASYNMIATMDLLHDFEESGMAKKATAFTIDKKIAKTEQAIADIQEKYKKQLADAEKQKSLVDENGRPIGEPVSRQMLHVQDRVADLQSRLDAFKAEKSENKLTPEQMKDLKNGFRVIGPDSKAWIIHQEVGPLWKNAMDMKGLYEDRGLAGSAYRNYMAGKAVYVRTKMLASLFHPTHEAVIDVSSDQASFVHHLIQGGKISDLLDKKMIPNIGLGKYTAKLQDSPEVTSWNTPKELRTPEQQAHVTRMVEGGFVPTVPRQDIVNFKENFNKAINGIGKNNLRLLGTALEIPSLPMAPLMEHWIPGMKTDSYFQRTDLALARDPSLATDAGRRSEAFRQIAQDIERNYGEMNRNTQFWNPVVRDIFNATTFSGGWKLAMLQNFRGLAEPAHIAYNWAKTGEFSKEQITHQMLQSYIYTANMLMLGAGLNYLFTGAVGTIKDWVNPQTGDKNADGAPVRLRQPAFFNEPIMLLHDIYSDGVVPGTGSFFYHQTLIPGIANNLLGRDFVGRPYITDPTDLHQWKNMGIESISPIALSNQERAEQKGSSVAEKMGWVGFPMAGAYINQTPFEQKVIGTYYALHPSEGGEYQTKLKAEMRGAVATHDAESQKEIEAEMKYEHMKPSDISNAKKLHTTPFSEFAWSKLSSDDQKRLIESASDAEKAKFKVKNP